MDGPPAKAGVAGAGGVAPPARRDGLPAKAAGGVGVQRDGPPGAGGARPDGPVAAGAAAANLPMAAAANPGPMVTGAGGPVRPAAPLLKLPDEWRLSMKKEDNVPNSSRDFSDVKRTCNRVLQRMYSEWQAEITNVRAMEHCTLQMAQANLLNANTCQQMEKKQHDELKKEHEALKTKLQQASSSEEEAVRKLASLNRTHEAAIAETESKHEAAAVERDRKHKAEILEIKKQHDEKVMEAASKLTKQLQDEIDDLKTQMDRRKAKDKAWSRPRRSTGSSGPRSPRRWLSGTRRRRACSGRSTTPNYNSNCTRLVHCKKSDALGFPRVREKYARNWGLVTAVHMLPWRRTDFSCRVLRNPLMKHLAQEPTPVPTDEVPRFKTK